MDFFNLAIMFYVNSNLWTVDDLNILLEKNKITQKQYNTLLDQKNSKK